MLPLFDLMMQAQNGQATEAMARQFGLAQEQMQKALSALMPAFSTGLKRTATNPYDFSALMAAMSSGNYTQYFEDMTKAFSPQGVADGNNILARIFGSKEVSRAIAAQAAQMSGIGQDILKRMMPVVANAMVGGFFRQIAEQFQATGDAIASGNTSAVLENWLKTAGFPHGSSSSQSSSPFENPFVQAFQTMMAGGQTTKPEPAADPFASNPFLQMFAAMSGATAEEKPARQPEMPALNNFFAQMFDSGIEVQKSYQRSMDNILESYFANLTGNDKSPPK